MKERRRLAQGGPCSSERAHSSAPDAQSRNPVRSGTHKNPGGTQAQMRTGFIGSVIYSHPVLQFWRAGRYTRHRCPLWAGHADSSGSVVSLWSTLRIPKVPPDRANCSHRPRSGFQPRGQPPTLASYPQTEIAFIC